MLEKLTDAIKDENATIEEHLALIEQLKETD